MGRGSKIFILKAGYYQEGVGRGMQFLVAFKVEARIGAIVLYTHLGKSILEHDTYCGINIHKILLLGGLWQNPKGSEEGIYSF